MPPVNIKVKDEKSVIQSKAYNLPFKFHEPIKNELKRLIDEDIIEERITFNSSPGFIISKKNGEVRLVIDYRKINENVIDINIGIPKIFENIQMLGQNRLYSKLDLKNGFNQLSLDKQSRDITGFVILNRNFAYKRVPLGLKSGPKLFQKYIQDILKDCRNCFVYIDDIIIFGKTSDEHDEALKEVLNRLLDHKVKLNFDKSVFKEERIELLGYDIQYDAINIIKTNLFNNPTINVLLQARKNYKKYWAVSIGIEIIFQTIQ